MALHTHYDNLKVARNAPPEVIRAAYRVLAQKYHPDRYHDEVEGARVLTYINDAYKTLIDPASRAEHDSWIKQRETAAAVAQRVRAAPRAPTAASSAASHARPRPSARPATARRAEDARGPNRAQSHSAHAPRSADRGAGRSARASSNTFGGSAGFTTGDAHSARGDGAAAYSEHASTFVDRRDQGQGSTLQRWIGINALVIAVCVLLVGAVALVVQVVSS